MEKGEKWKKGEKVVDNWKMFWYYNLRPVRTGRGF